MVARVHSFVLRGIDAMPCEIEADISQVGLPKTTIVGLPDAAVKEAAERVRTAMQNSGFPWPLRRVTINLAPADVRKEGPVYDLPVALAILLADGVIRSPSRPRASRAAARAGRPVEQSGGAAEHESGAMGATDSGAEGCAAPTLESTTLGSRFDSGVEHVAGPDAETHPEASSELEADVRPRPGGHVGPACEPRLDPDELLFAGELALDGRLRPVRGVISMALLARARGHRGIVVPESNAAEAAVVDGIEVLMARRLDEVVAFLNGVRPLPRHGAVDVEALIAAGAAEIDFADVRGQEAAKRAMTVAAAGSHNILLIGPAGTGKTMMARALPGVLPPLTRAEALEVTRIYSSIAALPRGQPVVARRPVRTPHHTASTAAIVGGGSAPRPGEVSLAHRGVLFLDELPEFSRVVLEALREPLEDGHVTIARAHSTIRFPARVMLVAAMNPTQQGGGRVEEVAADPQERYLARLSGPLVDRIDLHVEVPAVPFRQLAAGRTGADSASMRARVLEARAVQRERQGGTLNAELSGRRLDRIAALCPEGRSLLAAAMSELGLSARAYDKIRRVARTIADLDGAASIRPEHVAEAVAYRLLDRRR